MGYFQYSITYGFTYIFLAAAVIAVVIKHEIVALVLLISTFIAALLGESMSLVGLLALAMFAILTRWRFSILRESMYRRFPWTEPATDLLVVIACLTFFVHYMRGFHNTKIIDAMVMSAGGVPFSMYLNLDKTAAAIILALSGQYFTSGTEFDTPRKQAGTAETLKIIGLMWAGCIVTLIPIALAIGYIKFDPKIMPHFGIWAVNNLLFVAFAEEVLFRGMIQGTPAGLFLLSWLASSLCDHDRSNPVRSAALSRRPQLHRAGKCCRDFLRYSLLQDRPTDLVNRSAFSAESNPRAALHLSGAGPLSDRRAGS